jgi:cell division initiation protein
MEGLLEEHRQREGILKSTLLTAQKASDDIREGARRQAEAMVKESELQADKLLELAQSRAHEVESGILELRAQRSGLRTDIRALITRLTSMLDLQEEAELDNNLRFLKRREESGSS